MRSTAREPARWRDSAGGAASMARRPGAAGAGLTLAGLRRGTGGSGGFTFAVVVAACFRAIGLLQGFTHVLDYRCLTQGFQRRRGLRDARVPHALRFRECGCVAVEVAEFLPEPRGVWDLEGVRERWHSSARELPVVHAAVLVPGRCVSQVTSLLASHHCPVLGPQSDLVLAEHLVYPLPFLLAELLAEFEEVALLLGVDDAGEGIRHWEAPQTWSQ